MVEIFSILKAQFLDHHISLILMGITILGIGLFTYSASHIFLDFIEKICGHLVRKYKKANRKSNISPRLVAIIQSKHQSTVTKAKTVSDSFRWLIPEILLTSVKALIVFSIVAVLGLMIGTLWLKNIGAAIILAFLCILLPGQYLSRQDLRKQEKYISQFPIVVRTFLVALEQKGNARSAISYVAERAPEPSKSLFQTILLKIDSGFEPKLALKEITKEIKVSHAHLFEQLLADAYYQGTTLIPQFTRLAGQVDAMNELILENAQTTHAGRIQNFIMHFLVVILAVMLVRVLPESEKYLTQEIGGRTIVLLTFLSVLIGIIFDRMMSKVDA
ncbi:hypothetical protein Dred_0955 [Desulforamulus reducens MI-1]|uniref:Type II secretion system protein GspF domain-containing protein n=1 Tax=Desulforamulus reducens (strain ATCC BAA-1160 / DSM 100696 / MI-1) TaxID=349161 RepID=A4J337_DESRM|nr:hypothetical protein [Desulforamulus reducens]ABO49490.1 hypothetical protein Dred_0955 [Desulforamulus reducens MI-1]